MTTCWSASRVPATSVAPCSAPSATAAVPWMSSLKVSRPVAVAREDRGGVRGGEVLPLQQHVGHLVLDRGDEVLDERVVVLVVDAAVAPAEVVRVVEQVGVVGADVEQDRQRPRGVDAADEGVERELPDRDPHAADALVADAEDPLAVGHDDDVDLVVLAVAQHLVQVLAVGPREVEPARAAPEGGEAPAALRDGGRVDQRQRRGDVGGEHASRRGARCGPAASAGRRSAGGRSPAGAPRPSSAPPAPRAWSSVCGSRPSSPCSRRSSAVNAVPLVRIGSVRMSSRRPVPADSIAPPSRACPRSPCIVLLPTGPGHRPGGAI